MSQHIKQVLPGSLLCQLNHSLMYNAGSSQWFVLCFRVFISRSAQPVTLPGAWTHDIHIQSPMHYWQLTQPGLIKFKVYFNITQYNSLFLTCWVFRKKYLIALFILSIFHLSFPSLKIIYHSYRRMNKVATWNVKRFRCHRHTYTHTWICSCITLIYLKLKYADVLKTSFLIWPSSHLPGL